MKTMVSLSSVLLILCLSVANAWDNEYDQPLVMECPANEVIYHIVSHHDNDKEDRVWDFSCRNAGFSLGPCFWSGYVNNWDAPVDFRCPIQGQTTYAMSGVHSIHDNDKEDRRWDWYCCELIANCPPDCAWTDYVNTYDNDMDYTVAEGSYLNGAYSVHDNKKEDRIWKWNICQC